MDPTDENDLSIPRNAFQGYKHCVAVTGDVFRWMVDFGNEDVLNRVSCCPILAHPHRARR